MTLDRLRKIHKCLFWLWIFPGLPISLLLRNSVAYVVFISVYAVIVEHYLAWHQAHKEVNED